MVVGLSIGGLMSGSGDRRGVEGVDQECVMHETRIPFAALGIEDPERRPAPRRPVAVVNHQCLGALADDVVAQAEPRPASQFQADAGRLGDGGREATAAAGPAAPVTSERRGIEDQEQGLRTPGERGESMESIGDHGRPVRSGQPTAGQVEDEHVHRPARHERTSDGQTFVQVGRSDDHEPLEADATGNGLDRIEAA